jgi:hypothetical protein
MLLQAHRFRGLFVGSVPQMLWVALCCAAECKAQLRPSSTLGTNKAGRRFLVAEVMLIISFTLKFPPVVATRVCSLHPLRVAQDFTTTFSMRNIL